MVSSIEKEHGDLRKDPGREMQNNYILCLKAAGDAGVTRCSLQLLDWTSNWAASIFSCKVPFALRCSTVISRTLHRLSKSFAFPISTL